MNIWKIGSRWSKTGDRNNSLLSIFRRNNVVFLGEDKSQRSDFDKVKEGDYIAIADGIKIVSVAKAIKRPEHILLDTLKVNTREKGFLNEKGFVPGVKVKFYDFFEPIDYNRGKTFHHINDKDVIEQIKNAIKEFDSTQFSITSSTLTLAGNNQMSLLNNNGIKIRYKIPVYQRPYSWGEDQLYKFINDILEGYKNNKEPLFYGTIQLSAKKTIKIGEEYEQDIIDGQQRITTITLLLRVLKDLEPKTCNELFFDWLETNVNKGTEQKKLNDFFSQIETCHLDGIYEKNQYCHNAKYIKKILLNSNIQKDETESPFDYSDLYQYIISQLYFVVLETKAGLSKTLKIFNTINTTGLDLNGSDIFKVRFYEYLRDKEDQPEEVFDQINDLYSKVEECGFFNFERVLKFYQEYLFVKHQLPNEFYEKSANLFFTEYFDNILDGEKTDFQKVPQFRLKIEELKYIVEKTLAYYQTNKKNWSNDMVFYIEMISRFRYKKYCKIWNQLVLLDKSEEEISSFIEHLFKITFIYSVIFERHVKELDKYLTNCYKLLSTQNITDIISNIKSLINNKLAEWNSPYKSFEEEIIFKLLENQKKKDNVCRLIGYFDAKESGNENFNHVLFNVPFDIEHIHATNDNSIVVEKRLQNSLGNFSLLEQNINRSIQNISFTEKKKKYAKSQFDTIKMICKYNKWDKEEIENRNRLLYNKLTEYFNK